MTASENLSAVRSQVITRSGKLIAPLDLKPGDITPGDIAHTLAYECRWRGVLGFRSVAWHSLAVSWLLAERGASETTQLIGLLHDMGEVFTGDIATPVKKQIPEVEVFEQSVFGAMWISLGLPLDGLRSTWWPDVKEADADTGAYEYRMLSTSAMKNRWLPTYGHKNGKGAWPATLGFEEPEARSVIARFLGRWESLCRALDVKEPRSRK